MPVYTNSTSISNSFIWSIDNTPVMLNYDVNYHLSCSNNIVTDDGWDVDMYELSKPHTSALKKFCKENHIRYSAEPLPNKINPDGPATDVYMIGMSLRDKNKLMKFIEDTINI